MKSLTRRRCGCSSGYRQVHIHDQRQIDTGADVRADRPAGVEVVFSQTIQEVTPPAQRKGGIKVESVSELLDKLRNEAKVIS